MHIDGSTLTTHNNGDTCDISDYPLDSDNLSIANCTIHGRYPESGSARNTVCEQAYYILSGTATIYTNDQTHQVKAGDVYYFAPGSRYSIHGVDMKCVIINTPTRNINQYEHRDI